MIKRTITIDDTPLQVEITYKAVKNINARLHGEVLRVSAPTGIAQRTLDHAIGDLARRLVRRVRARQVNSETDALALAQQVARRFSKPPEVQHVLFVTSQEARWGSYSPSTRTIRLNATLRLMPAWVLEAVVAHELAHVIYPDHSSNFWTLLRNVEPNTDRAEAFLSGVTWLANAWEDLPAVERSMLLRTRTTDASQP
jgi:predicted metal-dependent hydrolase